MRDALEFLEPRGRLLVVGSAAVDQVEGHDHLRTVQLFQAIKEKLICAQLDEGVKFSSATPQLELKLCNAVSSVATESMDSRSRSMSSGES